MNAGEMERLLARHGFEVVVHDRSLLSHSNVAVFRKPTGA
jgi:hypothetical protein